MNETLLRNCLPADLPELVQLCAQHAQYEQAPYASGGKPEKLQQALFSQTPALYCLVAEWNRTLVGYASYTFDFSTWEAARFLYLDALFLLPDFRGKGTGNRLMELLRQRAIDNGCRQMQWQTPVFNEAGIRFYSRLGAGGTEKVRFCWDL